VWTKQHRALEKKMSQMPNADTSTQLIRSCHHHQYGYYRLPISIAKLL